MNNQTRNAIRRWTLQVLLLLTLLRFAKIEHVLNGHWIILAATVTSLMLPYVWAKQAADKLVPRSSQKRERSYLSVTDPVRDKQISDFSPVLYSAALGWYVLRTAIICLLVFLGNWALLEPVSSSDLVRVFGFIMAVSFSFSPSNLSPALTIYLVSYFGSLFAVGDIGEHLRKSTNVSAPLKAVWNGGYVLLIPPIIGTSAVSLWLRHSKRREILNGKWRAQLAAHDENPFPGQGNPHDAGTSKQLRKIRDLEEQVEILEKAVGILTSRPK